MQKQILVVAAAATLVTAGCGGSHPTSPLAPSSFPDRGATIRGSVIGDAGATSRVRAFSGSSGIRVRVLATSLETMTNSSGQFVLEGVPEGSVTLEFTGDGFRALLDIEGLEAGQVLVITVSLSGDDAEIVDQEEPPDDSDQDSDEDSDQDSDQDSDEDSDEDADDDASGASRG